MAIPTPRSLSVKTNRPKVESRPKFGVVDDEDEDIDQPVSPAGQIFLHPVFDCYVIAMIGFGKPIDIDVFKRGLEATLIRHPRFSAVLVTDNTGDKKPKWRQTKVVVEDHILIPHLDSANSSMTPDELVEDYVSSLTKNAMDYSQPLWELHILNLPTSRAASLVVFRIHHSLGDGMSLISLLLACTRKTSDSNSLPTLPKSHRSLEVKPKFHLSTFFVWLWALFILAWNTLVDIFEFIATSAFLKDPQTPLKGCEGVEYRPKRFVHLSASLDDIKEIKNALHCSVNDVLLGVTLSGLYCYLTRKHGENEKNNHFPQDIHIRSAMLVNVRESPGIHACSGFMSGKGSRVSWGNLIGYVILPFPIVKCKEPLDYVRMGKAIADKKKNSLAVILTFWAADLIVRILGIKVAAFLCHRVISHTTLSFSNIVGPADEIEFYGHPVVYLAPSVYGHPQALTVHYQSYMNKMTIVLAVDDSVIPDPHQLLDDLAESIKHMKEAII